MPGEKRKNMEPIIIDDSTTENTNQMPKKVKESSLTSTEFDLLIKHTSVLQQQWEVAQKQIKLLQEENGVMKQLISNVITNQLLLADVSNQCKVVGSLLNLPSLAPLVTSTPEIPIPPVPIPIIGLTPPNPLPFGYTNSRLFAPPPPSSFPMWQPSTGLPLACSGLGYPQ